MHCKVRQDWWIKIPILLFLLLLADPCCSDWCFSSVFAISQSIFYIKMSLNCLLAQKVSGMSCLSDDFILTLKQQSSVS